MPATTRAARRSGRSGGDRRGPRVRYRRAARRYPRPDQPSSASRMPMSDITEATVLAALRTVQEPELGGDLVTRNMVRNLAIDGSAVAFTIELTTPACPLKDQIEDEVRQALTPLG